MGFDSPTASTSSFRSTLSITGTTVLTAATIRDVMIIASASAATVTLPSVAAMLAVAFPPGANFLFVTTGDTGVITIVPNAADQFEGTLSSIRLEPGSTCLASVNMPAIAGGKWEVASRSNAPARSVGALTQAPATFTAATIRQVNLLGSSAAAAFTLPAISALITAGYPIGSTFTFAKDNSAANAVTIVPDAGDTFFGGATISLAGTAGHGCELQIITTTSWALISNA